MANLTKPKAEIYEKLTDRISKGQDLIKTIQSNYNVDNGEASHKLWTDYNILYLAKCFDEDSISEQYSGIKFANINLTLFLDTCDNTPEGYNKHRIDTIKSEINQLSSILDRLELYDDIISHTPPVTAAKPSNEIFIVYGHDGQIKAEVARTLEKLSLTPIILHEQANSGKTIIEKFEYNADRAGFAIIILTADDMGYAKNKDDNAKPRARQNVILELGYFTGKLGRDRVFMLYDKAVELPSDYHGVGYTPLDDAGAWKMGLCKELKNAGYNVDANKLF